jgi:protein gp37
MNKQGPGKIEYLDWTWNPITGCKHGCPYCYAARQAHRNLPGISMEPAFHPKRLGEPCRLTRPDIIGVSYTGDMWGKWVPREWIEEVLSMCRATKHKYLFLTKNPARYAEFEIPGNCWCGTSTTGAESEMHRLSTLFVSAPLGHLFVSLEPWTGGESVLAPKPYDEESIAWVIIGGLTGKGEKKPPKEDMEELIKSLHGVDIPVFIKFNAGVGPQEYPEGLR